MLHTNAKGLEEGSTSAATSSLPAARAAQTEPAFNKPGGEYEQEPNAVREAAERGIAGGGGPLPHSEAIQRAFGRHDVSGVRAHVGGLAAAAARAIGSIAYAMGNAVAFGKTPDLRVAAHEAAHVVQQRAGVSLSDGVGHSGDPYEQHADAVAERVVQGRSAEDMLDQYAGSASGERGVQRYAFINGKKIEKSEKDFTPEMQGMVSDTVVRDYTGVDEFKKHAGKQTDYLGNLTDGTWLRFEPTGMNILGEYHTEVTLKDVVPAVGSKNFISERLSVDVLKEGSNIKAAYEAENVEVFKKFGIEKEKDKKQFGAESLFPKIGFGLNLALPYFEGKKKMSNLKSGPDAYDGKPVQRYLKIAWAYSKDNKLSVEAMRKAKEKIPPKLEALAEVHAKVEGQLDKFITSLVVDGFIGDELVKKENAALLPPLLTFSNAMIEALVEMAVSDKSSRLSEEKRKEYSGAKSISQAEQQTLFSNWRNYLFEDNVNAAAKRGVRYAGMGQAHLDYLVKVGLPKNSRGFEMAGKDIKAFKELTKKLTEAAKKK